MEESYRSGAVLRRLTIQFFFVKSDKTWRFPDFGSLHVFCTAIFNCVSAAATEPDGRYFSAAHLNVNWGTALHNCFHKYHGILRQREPAAVLAQFQPLFVSHRPYSHHNYLPTMIPTQMISGNDMTVTTI